jgi:hypothetical protein
MVRLEFGKFGEIRQIPHKAGPRDSSNIGKVASARAGAVEFCLPGGNWRERPSMSSENPDIGSVF